MDDDYTDLGASIEEYYKDLEKQAIEDAADIITDTEYKAMMNKKEERPKKEKTADKKEGVKTKNEEQGQLLSHLDLPKDNFIMRYIDTMRTMTSAYPEWHFAMAVSILSVVSDRKICIELRHKVVYPNIWFCGLGLSTISQKTSAMRLGLGIMNILKINKNQLPKSFSPEGFLEALSTNPNGYLWVDEAGEILKSMEKDYMSNMRDLLCDLYECIPFYRKLKKSEIYIDPYINMILMTTPDNFKEYTEILDLTSGWLLRYLYLFPEYEKDYMPMAEISKEDRDKIIDLVKILKTKTQLISNLNKDKDSKFSYKFESGCLEFFDKWSKKMHDRIMKKRNSIEASIMGRLEDYAIKLALLFTFGENKVELVIRTDMLSKSCKVIDEYFLPTVLKIADVIGSDEKHNKIDKVLGAIKRHGGNIGRSDLIRYVHIKAKELDEICDTLMQGGEIIEYKIKGSTRSITHYKLVDYRCSKEVVGRSN